MNSKKVLPYGGLIFGGLIGITGIACVVIYIFEAIIARIGEPDQSLLFWYLPILFLGIFGIFIGLGIGILGAIRLKNIRQQSPSSDN
jgi:hypothetical protein